MFTFQDDTTVNERIYGPCLLKLLFDCINQNVVVGVKVFCQKLEAIKLHPYQNDVNAMLTDMEESYSKIINNKSTCESILRYMLNALLSGPNPKFDAFIDRIKDDIDLGLRLNNYMPHDYLATVDRAKYNNMVASDKYSKLDPKDAKILAQTKKVTALERSVSDNSANVTSGGGSGGGYRGNQGDKIAGVEKWRTSNKCSTIQQKGKTLWLCPSHKHNDGFFYGLYVWYRPEDHYA